MEPSSRSRSPIRHQPDANDGNLLAEHSEPAGSEESCCGLWLSPDLAQRTRPSGWQRSEKELAWLRNREQTLLGQHYLSLADSALAPPSLKTLRRKRLA